jgi:purine-nucleoside phosphorylase
LRFKSTRCLTNFSDSLKELKIGDKNYWFAIGYGGAWLSEYLHWACLFGTKKNVLLGSCGGLKPGIKQGDFIVPENSYSEESSARIYNRDSNIHCPNKKLSDRIANKLEEDGVGGEDCQWQSARESSPDSYAVMAEVLGPQNVGRFPPGPVGA